MGDQITVLIRVVSFGENLSELCGSVFSAFSTIPSTLRIITFWVVSFGENLSELCGSVFSAFSTIPSTLRIITFWVVSFGENLSALCGSAFSAFSTIPSTLRIITFPTKPKIGDYSLFFCWLVRLRCLFTFTLRSHFGNSWNGMQNQFQILEIS